jgi:hypothetical protein
MKGVGWFSTMVCSMRVLQRVRHLRAAAVVGVERIDWMMQRQDQRSIGGRGGELVGQPLLLGGVDRAVFRHVRVHADNGCERCHERPVHIGQIELHPRRVLGNRIDVGMRLHEVIDPAVQRGLRRWIIHLAVVIPRDGKDRDLVMGVRLIELRVVVVVCSGVIDHVPDVITELRLTALACVQVFDHLRSDVVLELAVLNAARVTDHVKDLLALLRDAGRGVGKFLREIVVVGRQVQGPRQWLEAGVAVADGIQRADARMRLRMPRPRARADGAAEECRMRGVGPSPGRP